jgi:hypothetical protein
LINVTKDNLQVCPVLVKSGHKKILKMLITALFAKVSLADG